MLVVGGGVVIFGIGIGLGIVGVQVLGRWLPGTVVRWDRRALLDSEEDLKSHIHLEKTSFEQNRKR